MAGRFAELGPVDDSFGETLKTLRDRGVVLQADPGFKAAARLIHGEG